MSTVPVERACPFCGRPCPVAASRRPSCGGQVAGKKDDLDVVDFLVPRKVSGWSLAACYLGLVGLFLPLLGLFFAIPALVCGVLALARKRQGVTYGSVTSDIAPCSA